METHISIQAVRVLCGLPATAVGDPTVIDGDLRAACDWQPAGERPCLFTIHARDWTWSPRVPSVAHRFHFHPLARLDPKLWKSVVGDKPEGWES